MPMDFPDMKSLTNAAELWKFRKPNKDETEDQYRIALADYVEPRDFIESQELRYKVRLGNFIQVRIWPCENIYTES